MVLRKRAREGDFKQHTGTSVPHKKARRDSPQPSASKTSPNISSKLSVPLPTLSQARPTAAGRIVMPGEATTSIPAALQTMGQTPPGPSEPQPTKAPRSRKKKLDPDAPTPEKRGAVFKKACPKNILDRVDRVMSQRLTPCPLFPIIFLISTRCRSSQVFHD